MSLHSSFAEDAVTPGVMPPDELARAQQLYADLLLQTDSGRVAGRLSRTYAEALLTVAEKQDEADAVAGQLKSLTDDLFQTQPALEAFLNSPAVNRKAKDAAIVKLFDGKASPLFLDFLRVLNKKDRLGIVRLVAVAYRALRDNRANRERVLVESAVPLSADQLATLKATLGDKIGKTAVLVPRVNPDLLGGMVVHAGDRVFDTSLRTKLQALRNQLTARGSHEIQGGRDRIGS